MKKKWLYSLQEAVDECNRLSTLNELVLEALEKIVEIGRQKDDARPQDAVSCFVIAEVAIVVAKGEI